MIDTQAVPAIVRAGPNDGPEPVHVAGLSDPASRSLGLRLTRLLPACGVAFPASLGLDVRPPRPGRGGRSTCRRRSPRSRRADGSPGCLVGIVAAGVSVGRHAEPVEGIEAMAIQTEARGLTLICADGNRKRRPGPPAGRVVGVGSLGAAIAHLAGPRGAPRPAEHARASGAAGFAEAPAPPGFAPPGGGFLRGRGDTARAGVRQHRTARPPRTDAREGPDPRDRRAGGLRAAGDAAVPRVQGRRHEAAGQAR